MWLLKHEHTPKELEVKMRLKFRCECLKLQAGKDSRAMRWSLMRPFNLQFGSSCLLSASYEKQVWDSSKDLACISMRWWGASGEITLPNTYRMWVAKRLMSGCNPRRDDDVSLGRETRENNQAMLIKISHKLSQYQSAVRSLKLHPIPTRLSLKFTFGQTYISNLSKYFLSFGRIDWTFVASMRVKVYCKPGFI
jgi:hypothetical protein